MGFENFKKILGISLTSAAALNANAKNTNSAEKMFADSTKNITTPIENPGELKQGEKFREIPVNKEVAGIKVDGMILIPMQSDTTKEYYLVKFSGDGENIIGKELAALNALGLKPASSRFLNGINDEAFRKVGKSVKAIDEIYEEAENLGQNQYMVVGRNKTVKILNALKQEQTTEVGAMKDLGTTTEYATFACRDKKKNNTTSYESGLASTNK